MTMGIMLTEKNNIHKSLHQMAMTIQDSNVTAEEQRLIDMDDRIDSYLRGQMTKEEESQFISDCENNRELKERAYLTALLTKVLNTK